MVKKRIYTRTWAKLWFNVFSQVYTQVIDKIVQDVGDRGWNKIGNLKGGIWDQINDY